MSSETPSDTIFVCLDPLGRRIVASRARWIGHLRVRHPEVAAQPDAVRLTLEAPSDIAADLDNPDGLNYYRPAVLLPPHDRLYLKVCISFHRRDRAGPLGEFVAAYPTKRLRRGEVQQWP